MSQERIEVGINDLPKLVTLNPHISKLIIGWPGDGKTSVLKTLEEKYGEEYYYIYLDAPSLETQDIGMTMPNAETKSLEYWINETTFKIRQAKAEGKKLCIMIDEGLKASRMVKLAMTKILLEQEIGNEKLPEGSPVFMTSNDPRMGIGDSMEQHLGNRVCIYYLRKVSTDEYIKYKADRGLDPALGAFLERNDDCLADTTEPSHKDNAMSMNFNQPPRQAVTPRSLCKVNDVIKQRHKYGDLLQATIAGLCGRQFAERMSAYVNVADKVHTFKDVMDDPKGVSIAENPTILVIQTTTLALAVKTEEEFKKCYDYVERVDKVTEEVGQIFKIRMMKDKKQLFMSDGRAKSWLRDNADLIV